MNAPRKLAAILAADVAGYSRLTRLDEEGTLKRLRKLRRELINPAVSLHRGRIVKSTGDGLLIEFPSVVEAVRCALDLQRGMDGRNADVPAEQRIEFRVGINLGDVVVEGNDLLGDGVNVAARLEGIAEPGGICISDAAYQQVRDKLDAHFEDAGEQQLKNIARPVLVYRVRVEKGAPLAPVLTLPDKPSIAVMAFVNMSGDPEQEHFGDGIAEDIITALSKLRWLFVIARNSSFIYKIRPTDVKQIGRELGVRYILEGSVRKAGNRVRITGQLIEAASGAHIWAERYDRELTDLFAVQDEITSSVASQIGPALADAERQRVMRKAPESLDAWEAYHRGFWHFLKQDPAENETAKIYFQRAIAIDPNFGSGYCGLALTHLWDAWLYHTRSFPECVTVARPLAQRAITLDDGDAMAHFALGWVFGHQGDIAGWRAEAERGVSLDPNNAWVLSGLASYYAFQGSAAEALSAIQKMMRASPHDPMMWLWMSWIAFAKYFACDYEGTLEAAQRLIRFRPEVPIPYRWRAAALGQLGRINEAREALQEAIEASPTNFYGNVRMRHPYMRPDRYEHMLEGLRKAGLPE